jgi:hypothetical protein
MARGVHLIIMWQNYREYKAQGGNLPLKEWLVEYARLNKKQPVESEIPSEAIQ